MVARVSQVQWVESTIQDSTLGRRVEVLVRIRDNGSKEIRDFRSTMVVELGEDYPDTYEWSDGNRACDCSRACMFHRDPGYQCSCSSDKYSVNLYNALDGVAFYIEF